MFVFGKLHLGFPLFSVMLRVNKFCPVIFSTSLPQQIKTCINNIYCHLVLQQTTACPTKLGSLIQNIHKILLNILLKLFNQDGTVSKCSCITVKWASNAQDSITVMRLSHKLHTLSWSVCACAPLPSQSRRIASVKVFSLCTAVNICAVKGLRHHSISKTITSTIYFTSLTQLSRQAINFLNKMQQ